MEENSFWDRVLDMFAQSIIISGALAIGVWGSILYLSIVQTPIPDVLAAGGALILGFFFGAKSGQQTERVQALNAFARTASATEVSEE